MGGLRIGLEMGLGDHNISYECVKTSEIKPYALTQLRSLYPEEEFEVTDITKLGVDEFGDIDVLIGGFPCFVGSTLVLTKDGYKRIDEVQVGDEVLTHRNRYRKVLNVFNQGIKQTVVLSGLGFKDIQTTSNHKFLVRLHTKKGLSDAQWVEVGDFRANHYVGIPIDLYEGSYQDIEFSDCFIREGSYYWLPYEAIRVGSDEVVYDIEVEEDHSFTANNIIVHNCQTFSMAGKRMGFEDTRGTLFYELARIMESKKPRFCIFENVKGLLLHDGGRTLQVILNTFEELGYHVSYKVFDAVDYGCAAHRERVFIVCHRDFKVDLDGVATIDERLYLKDIMDYDAPDDDSDYARKLVGKFGVDFIKGKTISDKKRASSVIHSWEFEARGEVSDLQVQLLESILKVQLSKGFNKNGKKVGMGHIESVFTVAGYTLDTIRCAVQDLINKKYLSSVGDDGVKLIFGQLSGKFTRILDPERHINTITATDGRFMGVPTATGLRRLTLQECLVALGFPDDYKFYDGINTRSAYDLLGNTVAPPVARYITSAIIEQELDETKRYKEVEEPTLF